MNNTIKVLNIIALTAVIALLGGCFSPWAGDGATITINVGGGSGRAVFPPDDATLAQIRYTVELQGPSNITEQLAHGTQSINLSVIPGDYTITVTASIDGELYAISIATAVARAGQSTRVDILMNYVGDGFIIFFETGSGSSINPQIVKRGEKVERPQKNPTWSIYGFVDWYSDKDLKNKFDFDEPVISSVTSKITLYAKWNQVTHTVTFDSNNDSGAIASEIVGDGGTLPPPKEDPILNGSVFGGWYIGDNEYVFNTEIHDNITIYAKWNAPVFDNITDLGAYLSKWSANDPENPYTVSLTVDNISTLRATLNANAGKYVYLDLTNSNIETIPDNTFYGSANPRGCATLAGIAIPDSVETIGNNAFNNCTKLASVELPINDYFTSIGNGAFVNCTNLASITIPDSVKTIGNYAFSSCANLASVTIGSGVTSIGTVSIDGQGVFGSCRNLTEINVDLDNTKYSSQDGVLYNENKTTLVAYPSATGSITILDSVTTIGQGAFTQCTGLTDITIPVGVTTIGQDAFTQCTGLTDITIPDSVETIGVLAFNGCTKLDSITIPASVTSVGQNAFASCTNLTSITLNANIESVNAFSGIPSLTSVAIGSGVTSIGNGAFMACIKLDTVTFTSSSQVTTIGRSAFSNCTSLADITIPNSVTTIGLSAFQSCTGLTDITIPASVTSIGQEAFRQCTSLTSVTFATGSNITNTNFENNAFPEGTNGNGGNTLKIAYNDAASPKAGTYTRDENGDTWNKSL